MCLDSKLVIMIVGIKTLMQEVRDVLVCWVQGAESLCSRSTRLNVKLPSISVFWEIKLLKLRLTKLSLSTFSRIIFSLWPKAAISARGQNCPWMIEKSKFERERRMYNQKKYSLRLFSFPCSPSDVNRHQILGGNIHQRLCHQGALERPLIHVKYKFSEIFRSHLKGCVQIICWIFLKCLACLKSCVEILIFLAFLSNQCLPLVTHCTHSLESLKF